jgi:hypothetical protein
MQPLSRSTTAQARSVASVDVVESQEVEARVG